MFFPLENEGAFPLPSQSWIYLNPDWRNRHGIQQRQGESEMVALEKEAEEKVLRECGMDEATIEQIRIDDRAEFNSDRCYY